MFRLRSPIPNPNLLKHKNTHTHTHTHTHINFKLVISKILSISFIVTTLLLSCINIAFQPTLVQLNLIESLSKHESYE